jgi:hypothetical protein
MVVKFNNFMRSIPNDDDLDSIYESERKVCKEKMDSENGARLNRAKSEIILQTQWRGSVYIKPGRLGMNSAVPSTGTWNTSSLLVQGRRLVWWDNERDMLCAPPRGQLLLCGHAGVSNASIIDQREVQAMRGAPSPSPSGVGWTHSDADSLLSVFGSDEQLQPAKCTILCATAKDRDTLSEAIKLLLLRCN